MPNTIMTNASALNRRNFLISSGSCAVIGIALTTSGQATALTPHGQTSLCPGKARQSHKSAVLTPNMMMPSLQKINPIRA